MASCTTSHGEEAASSVPTVNGFNEDNTALKANGPVTEAEDAAQLEDRRQSQLRDQHRFTRAELMIPPENFAFVEYGLYRSVSRNGLRIYSLAG